MKIILYFLTIFFLFLISPVYAMSNSEYVSAIEKKLFGTTFENQSMNERVDRIEMQIYDNHYSGKPEERLDKIDKIYPRAEFETGKAQHPKDLFKDSSYNDMQDYNEPAKYNDYPIVSEIEQSMYKKDYKGEDIYKRLSRLETELYGNTKEDMSLQERVENLKTVLPKKTPSRTSNRFDFNNFDIPNQNYSYTSDSFNNSALVSEIERETFNKTYSNESINKRIARLEQYYFGNVYMGQSQDERISRIASVTNSSQGMREYFPSSKGAQWAGILMNLLMIGLGFLL